ncbi:hypothetical protein SK128_014465, partial [Halocaridina rubra]
HPSHLDVGHGILPEVPPRHNAPSPSIPNWRPHPKVLNVHNGPPLRSESSHPS